MTPSLTQRRLLTTYTYALDYHGVHITRQHLNRTFTTFVPYESIPATRLWYRKFEKVGVTTTAICAVIAVLVLIGAIHDSGYNLQVAVTPFLLVAVPAALTWFGREEFQGFGTPLQGLKVYANKPSRDQVAAFLTQVHAHKLTYLREMYGDTIPGDTPQEQLRFLLWMKDLGAYSDAEFDHKKAGIVHTERASGIGFQQR